MRRKRASCGTAYILPPRALKTLCRKAGIRVFSLERGLLPGYLVVDQEGINFAGSLGGAKWEAMKPFFPEPDPGPAEEYITRFASERTSVVNKGAILDAGVLRSRLKIPAGTRVVLIPNQIDGDTNIVYFSENFPTNEDVITEVASAVRGGMICSSSSRPILRTAPISSMNTREWYLPEGVW